MLRTCSVEVSSNMAKKLLGSPQRFDDLVRDGYIRTRTQTVTSRHAKVFCNLWDVLKSLIATTKDRDKLDYKTFEYLMLKKLKSDEEN